MAVGAVGDFPQGSVTLVELEVPLTVIVPDVYEEVDDDTARVPVYVINHPKVGLLALSAFDPFSGCHVRPASEASELVDTSNEGEVVFVDPCNGSFYDLAGAHIEGPGPRGLGQFGLSVDGRVFVDLADYRLGPPR